MDTRRLGLDTLLAMANVSQLLGTFLALRIPLVSYVLDVFAAGWLAIGARKEPLGNTTSIGGRSLGCPKGQRIASTQLSFELAAASAGIEYTYVQRPFLSRKKV